MTTDPNDLIAQADAALEGVTEGPWTVEHETGETLAWEVGDTCLIMEGFNDKWQKCQMCNTEFYPWVPENLRDWDFIAASRSLVPALRDTLAAALAERDALKADNERLTRPYEDICRAERARIAAALRQNAERAEKEPPGITIECVDPQDVAKILRASADVMEREDRASTLAALIDKSNA